MTPLNLLPVFLVGLAGSVHCVGMCGGIVSAFSMAPTRPFPVAVVNAQAGSVMRLAAYNTGRIGSYMVAGALAGGMTRALAGLSGLQMAGFWLANLMLVALGLHLMDAWRGLAVLERAGQGLWRRMRPLMRFILPVDSPAKLLAMGALWGWLPCGMVYSVLLTASMSGSAAGGAAVMLAFGLGTLPMLLAMGVAGARLREALQQRAMRITAGLVVLSFGMLGLWRASAGVHVPWLDALCLVPA
ncbi:MAG: sulfite exporter TauE/SafE family protein [Pseudomonadota bacterium]